MARHRRGRRRTQNCWRSVRRQMPSGSQRPSSPPPPPRAPSSRCPSTEGGRGAEPGGGGEGLMNGRKLEWAS